MVGSAPCLGETIGSEPSFRLLKRSDGNKVEARKNSLASLNKKPQQNQNTSESMLQHHCQEEYCKIGVEGLVLG